jgi:hypothetical protein
MPNRSRNFNSVIVRRMQLWTCVPILLTSFVIGRAQAIKLDEIPDLSADDTQAHLDLFAKRLSDEPQATGALIAYYPENWPPGFFLRHIHGYADYLVNSRGIAADRFTILLGGVKTKFHVEFWWVPPGSSAPISSSTTLFRFNQLIQFDSLYFGPGCESEYTLTLEDPSDAIPFFASALQQNSNMRGLVLLYPRGSRNDRASRTLFASSTQKLVKEHSISRDRLITSFLEPRTCGDLQLWLLPPDLVLPKGQTVGTYLQSQLMAEAVEKRYTIRTVYFDGIPHTPDNLLRKKMPELIEGELFTMDRLRKSLAAVSRLSVINPVRISDVEAHLNRKELTIDLTLFFRERPRGRK